MDLAVAAAQILSRARRMKILHVYRTFFPDTQGGLEEVIRVLARGTQEQGADVVVLYPSREVRRVEESLVDGVRVCRVPELFELASCNVFVRGIGAFRRWAAWADVVHYHFPWPFADVLHLVFAVGIKRKTVITYHSDVVRQKYMGQLYAPLMRRFLRAADVVVATSENYVRSSQELQRLIVAPMVIPIGIDDSRLANPDPEQVDEWRSRVGSDFFLFIGVLRYYKGLDVLLRAVAGTSLQVVIAGDGPEGPRLRSLASSLGLMNVRFLGRIPDRDKCALLSLARAFVMPSNQRSEAYGVALLEAMCFALPLITTDIETGTSFVNVNGETGLWVPPDDPVRLREAMLKLQQDEVLCRSMGAAARLRVASALNARSMITAYLSLYRALCNKPPGSSMGVV